MFTTVHKAKSSQNQLLGSRESVSISGTVADQLGVDTGAQLRIRNRDSDLVGAYTIREQHENPEAPVRMAKRGREQLEATPGFDAEIRTTVPRTDLSYQTAWRTDECVETVWHDPEKNPQVAFVAPHGGDGERNTDEAAVFASKKFGLDSCSTWAVHNFGPAATGRWHITSSRISPVSYPGLQRLHGYDFDRAVSFHLWDGDEIIVGGLADGAFRAELGETISTAVNDTRDVITEDGKYMGDTEANVVNWLTEDNRSGIQIEAPAYICQRYRKRLGEAVATFFREN